MACALVLAFIIPLGGASAQGSTPPYNSGVYPSRSAAIAACSADRPWVVGYWSVSFPPNEWTLKEQSCPTYPYSSNSNQITSEQTWISKTTSAPQSETVLSLVYYITSTCVAPSTPANSNCVPYTPAKNLGCGCENAGTPPQLLVGNPINIGTGNKVQPEQDFGSDTLSLTRYYNSDPNVRSANMGIAWLTNYDRSISYTTPGVLTQVTVARADGQELIFNKVSGLWSSDSDVADRLVETDDANGKVAAWQLFIAATREYESYSASGWLLTISDESHVLASLGYTIGIEQSTTGTTLPPGLLATVTNEHGRKLSFHYDNLDRLASVTLPDSGVITYSYSTGNYLSSVTYPDASVRQYLYDEAGLGTGSTTTSGKLTGIIDENNGRYGTYGYQADGRAILTQHGQGEDLHKISYSADGMSATVTYPSGISAAVTFANSIGMMKIAGVDTSCNPGCGQTGKAASYDTNGYPASTTDFNNNLTTTKYDVNGLLDQQVDASGTASQRTTNTNWSTALRVPLTRTVSDASGNVVSATQWIYNPTGQALARCDIDPTNSASSGYACAATGTVPTGVRRTTYTYCTAVDTIQCPIVGLLLTARGPRTDLTQTTTYSYYTTSSAVSCGTPGAACYQPGDLESVTDALGHVTTIASYDGAGRVTRITDANGVNTDMTYTPRGWLASRSVGGSTTAFTYMPYGEVQTITDPDGVVTTYGYDSAHRLTDITDAQGNDLHYTLDAAGNKTAEQISTAAGTVVHSLSRSYNALGQLTAVIDGLNQTVFNAGYSDSYDANGNLTHSADGRSIQRQQTYDALNRLKSTLDNYNGTDTATANTTTTTSQDALDRVASVTDPSGLVTSYTHDGLSDLTTLQSPDSGTSTATFDAAGNVLTHTDAKGTVATSTYDALDRKTSTTYTDTTANVTFTYDEANSVTGCAVSAPIGRLTRMVEHAVSTTYCYDARGNVIQKMQAVAGTTDTTSYRYTAANRLSGETTPDGTVIGYAFNSNGRINAVNVTPSGASAASTVISATTWLPFGPISSYILGNGQTVTRTYDANYRATDITSPAFNLHLARDLMGNVSAIGASSGANPATETYAYDPLYRLGSVNEANGTTLESYTYNQTGDRLSKTASGLATGAYLYTTGTHQLKTIGNAPQADDANGNTTGSVIGGGTYGYAYNARNRLSLAQLNGSTVGTYTYNALGQRIGKVTTTTERYGYDESGQLLAEYGATNRDYIWLGSLPVAVVDNTINGSVTTSVVNYVIADQLNTPRAVTNSAGTVIWQWAYQGNPFGEQQPTSSAGYVLNLRFPGQYYDAETGLIHNDHRDYCTACGRYIQSDPIGLAGGISTFSYTRNNALRFSDPRGLQFAPPEVPAGAAAEEGAAAAGEAEAAAAPIWVDPADPATWPPSPAPEPVWVDPSDPSTWPPSPAPQDYPNGKCPASGIPNQAPNFIVTKDGTAYPVPNGATGPEPANNGQGMQFQGGSGGNGLDPRTSGFRFMDPVTSGNYQYPDGYGSYNNANDQTVNPYTGSPNISKSDPLWHIAPGG